MPEKGFIKGNEIVYQTEDEIGLKCSNCNDIFIISPECLFDTQKFTWYKNNKGYIISSNSISGQILLHRYLLRCELNKPENENLVVDHIDRNPLNNRMDNLRIVSQRENTENNIRSINKPYQMFGAIKDKRNPNVYKSRITIGDKNSISLGSYNNIYDAGLVYDRYIYLYRPVEEYTCTNLLNGRIPQEELEKRGIKELSDIPFIPSRKKGNNNNYYGVIFDNRDKIWTSFVIIDNHQKYIYRGNSELEAAMYRELFLLDHPELLSFNQLNCIWPEEVCNKIIIANQLLTKDEMEERTRGY